MFSTGQQVRDKPSMNNNYVSSCQKLIQKPTLLGLCCFLPAKLIQPAKLACICLFVPSQSLYFAVKSFCLKGNTAYTTK